MDEVQSQLRRQYAGEPFADLIVTMKARSVAVESYLVSLPGAVHGTTVYHENWKNYMYGPGEY